MLKFNVQRFFKVKGIDRPYTYLIQKGFTPGYATRLNTGKLKIMNLREVEKLCGFFECSPNDLLEWIPDKEVTDTSKHPLRDLIRVDSGVNIKAILNALPIAKLAEAEKLIKALKEK
jgi:Cro/C1-type HTH DNA-binding domain